MDDDDPRQQMALCRYQALSAYLALDPPRGQRRALLEQLAQKTWPGPDGEPLRASAETLRSWVRRYRREGLLGLMDKPRPQRGVRVLSAEQIETVLALKREVPERSLDRLLRIAEQTKLVEPGVLRRSTLHRVLKREGISGRPASASDAKDLDRFEALAPNDLWQSDMRTGPWLPALESLRSRVTYAHALRPFTIEDTRNYLRFHLERAEVDPSLLSDDAARKIFQASQGKPRNVNQLALHALIAAAAQARDEIDGRFMQQMIAAHPLYRSSAADART